MKKETEENKIGIRFGALCDSISKQVKDQGLKIPKNSAAHFQKDADAIIRLKFRGIISEGEANSAMIRLVKKIGKEVYR
jgi:hypothetical protein